MTPIRWMFEHIGLQNKEQDQWKHLRRMTIALLGLNTFSKTRFKKPEDSSIEEIDRFMPLSMFLNQGINEQLMEEYFQDQELETMMEEDAEYEKKLDDPESFIAELEIVDLENKEWIQEEGPTSFTHPPDKKIKVDE
jgi:hypothetical protein